MDDNFGNIIGDAETREVRYGVIPLYPDESQRIINHSPDGFAWGYGGSGPAQLALAILLKYANKRVAKEFYQDFKREVIAAQPADKDFLLPIANVGNWLKAKNAQF